MKTKKSVTQVHWILFPIHTIYMVWLISNNTSFIHDLKSVIIFYAFFLHFRSFNLDSIFIFYAFFLYLRSFMSDWDNIFILPRYKYLLIMELLYFRQHFYFILFLQLPCNLPTSMKYLYSVFTYNNSNHMLALPQNGI